MINVSYPAILGLFADVQAPGRTESASFLIWYLVNYYRLHPDDAIDLVCDQGGDRGIDGIFVNDADQSITVFQCKLSQRDNSSIGDATLRHLAGAITQLSDPDSVNILIADGGQSQLAGLLKRIGLAEKVLTHELRGEFVSNIELDANGRTLLATAPNVSFVGRDRLTQEYISDSRELPEGTPASFDTFGVDVARYVVDAETSAFIVPVKAKELVALSGIADQSLYAFNVRGPLGRTDVNRDINRSIEDRSKHKRFPLFHNGITIIAKGVTLDTDRLTIANYYVVNGCQSLTSLYNNRGNLTDDLRILLKVIQLEPGSVEAEEITNFSNTQNGVKARDFKSNNSSQIRLQNEFKDKYAGRYTFEIKTGEKLEKGDKITNEEAGLLIMACDLGEPWNTHRRYQVFEDKFADIFGRPDTTADKIVLLHLIAQAVMANLDFLTNKPFKKHVLTKHMILFAVYQVVKGEIPTMLASPQNYLNDPAMVNRVKLAFNALANDLIIVLDLEVKDLDIEFDYRSRLRGRSVG